MSECCRCNASAGVTQTLEETFFTSSQSLHDAVIKNDVTRLRKLVVKSGRDIDEVDSAGYSALLYARTAEIVDVLVLAGASQKSVTREGRRGLLHRAAVSGSYAFIQHLLKQHQFVDTRDKEGKFARDLARDAGRDDIVALFHL